MANIRVTAINNTSARGVIENLLNPANTYTLFEIELWNYDQSVFYYTQSWTDSSSNNYSYIDFSGLGVGTGYTFKGFAKSGGNRNFVGAESFFTTSPPLPSGVGTINVVSHENSLDISWSNASDVESYVLEVRLGNSGGALVYSNYSLVSTSQTVSGLISGTSYYIKAYAKNSQGNGTPSETTASTSSSRPSNFSWTTLNPTSNTYTSGKLRVNLVSSGEWNSFCSRINQFRIYKGLTPSTFTTATSSNDFTQAMYDEAVSAISGMATVTQPIGFYSKLIALKDALNSIN